MQLSSTTSAQLQDDFLTLLVTQLSNQDPLAPTSQEDFIGQLAQFSTVEGIEGLNAGIESLNARFEDVLYMQQLLSGFDLAGKSVTYYSELSGEKTSGFVSEVSVENGLIRAQIDGETVPLQNIIGVVAETDQGSN